MVAVCYYVENRFFLLEKKACAIILKIMLRWEDGMQMENMISVIIPAYNCATTIRQAIDSALQQDVLLEVIVINDASTDNLDAIMQEYEKDTRIIYLKNEQNKGPSATRNRGIAKARGEYVAFLDSDDYWEKEKLIRQWNLLQTTNMVLCSTGRELITHEGELTGRVIPVKEQITYEDMLHQNWINNSSVLVRKEVLLEFPMENDEVHEDYLLWLKVLQKYKVVCAINEPLLKYRMSNNSKSGSKWKSAYMTYKTYRYLGMGNLQALKCFISYAIAGFKKYYT